MYVAANYILLCLVWFFESQFFTTTNVLYYVISLKASPLRWRLLSLPSCVPLPLSFTPQFRGKGCRNSSLSRPCILAGPWGQPDLELFRPLTPPDAINHKGLAMCCLDILS